MKRFKRRAGFTLVEIIAVLVIIGILAAIAVPSIAAYLQMGYQTNRMSIARTIFLGAQNQLTEMRITGELENSDYGTYDPTSNVYTALGSPPLKNPDDPDAEGDFWSDIGAPGASYGSKDDGTPLLQTDVVQFIRKPKGPGNPGDPVYDLLNPVIVDKSILNEAILIEYNIRTGVVLSAFYGDAVADGVAFGYTGTGNDSVAGKRGIDDKGYEFSDTRRQGYYGVGETGTLDDPLPESSISLYDGATSELPTMGTDMSLLDRTAYDSLNPRNVLYAHIRIRTPSNFNLTLRGTRTDGEPLELTPLNVNIQSELVSNGNGDIYYLGEKNDYNEFVWIIDHVNGDTTDGVDTIFDTSNFGPEEITAVLVMNPADSDDDTDEQVFTSNRQFPYSYGVDGGAYSVQTARHLYDIRYALGENFVQYADIDLTAEEVDNFRPIDDLTGSYDGSGYAIRNLNISVSGAAGLFATNSGTIRNVTLEGVTVTGGSNVGAVAGSNSGGIDGALVNNATVSATGADVGGIVGSLSGTGIVRNATFVSASASVPVTGSGNVGGIVGSRTAVDDETPLPWIRNVLYLALAPKSGDNIVPITAVEGSIGNAYFLSGDFIRPDAAVDTSRTGYNTEPVVGEGEGFDTWDFYIKSKSGDLNFGEKWTQYPGDELQSAANVDNTDANYVDEYPYPFLAALSAHNPDDPHWPIAQNRAAAEVFYTEWRDTDNNGAFDDKAYDYFLRSTVPVGGAEEGVEYRTLIPDTGVVLHDSYGVHVKGVSGVKTYILALGALDVTYEITVNGETGAVTEVYEIDLEEDERTAIDTWPSELVEKGSVRVFIPNHIAEAAALNDSDLRIPIELKYNDTDLLDPEKTKDNRFYPAFAPVGYAANTAVRSPRHIDNIDIAAVTLGGSYQQTLNVDFGAYCREITTALALSTPIPTNAAPVAGVFTGIYDGGAILNEDGSLAENSLEIRNLTIAAGGTEEVSGIDNVGLFAQSGGTIQDVTMVNANVTGNSNVGSVVGNATAGTLTNIAVNNSVIAGTTNVGGIAGSSAGSITNAQISGTLSTNDQGIITGTTAITGTTNVGGIVGHAQEGSIGDPDAEDSDITVTDITVTAVGDFVGGVAGSNGRENDPEGDAPPTHVENLASQIANASVNNIIISGANRVGGIVGNTETAGNISAVVECEVINSSVTGGANIGGVAGYSRGDIDDVIVDGTTIRGTNTCPPLVGGVTGVADGRDRLNGQATTGGRIRNSVVRNTNISGEGTDVGGIAGHTKDGAEINGALVSETTVSGGNGIGGIGGIVGNQRVTDGVTTVQNATFVSASASVPVTGGANVGGIVGLRESDTATITNVLYLALAPKVDDNIIPITQTGIVANAYYLRGGYIRPTGGEVNPPPADPEAPAPQGRNGYNKEAVLGSIGRGYDTWGFYEMLNDNNTGYALPGWAKNPDLTNMSEVNSNSGEGIYKTIYPYPFLNALSAYNPVDPRWPIALDVATATLFYAEAQFGVDGMLYDEGLTGSITRKNIVLHDSYGLNIHGLVGTREYIITLGEAAPGETAPGETEPITIIATINVTAETITTDSGMVLPFVFYETTDAAETVFNARVFLPNSVAEAASLGEDIPITLTGSGQMNRETTFNPSFAPAAYSPTYEVEKGTAETTAVRSPRHIDNIDLSADVLGDEYQQVLNVDFALYLKELERADEEVTPKENTEIPIDLIPVNGIFSGTYDGGAEFNDDGKLTNDSLEIRKLTVETDGNAGLFASNTGTIHSLTMRDTKITSTGDTANIGGVVAESTGPLSNITVIGTKDDKGLSSTMIQSIGGTGQIRIGGVVGTAQNAFSNINVTDINILSDDNSGDVRGTGGVAGTTIYNDGDAAFNGIKVTGTIIVSGGQYVGGVVGSLDDNEITIENADITGTNINGFSDVGGVSGTGGTFTDITVSNSHITGGENADGDNVGGVSVSGTINGSVKVINNTTVRGKNNVGGVIAKSTGQVIGVTVDGITVIGFDFVGGVIGHTGDQANTSEISGITVKNTDVLAPESGSADGGQSGVGGVAGYNNRKIGNNTPENIIVDNVSVNGQVNVGGVAGYNPDGQITNVSVSGAEVIGTGNNVGGVAGQSSGEIGAAGDTPNITVTNTTVSGTANIGGVAGSSEGAITNAVVIKNINVSNIMIMGTNSNIGGIAGTASAKISQSRVSGVKVSGLSNVGGIAGQTSNDIEDSTETITVLNAEVFGTQSHVGGVVGQSSAEIINVHVKDTDIESPASYIGGVAGSSEGAITNVIVSGIEVNGGADAEGNSYTGGVAGQTIADITNVSVSGAEVIGTGNNVGGVAGQSSGEITTATVHGEFNAEGISTTAITGTANVGGVAGQSSLAISDIEVTGVEVEGGAAVGGVAGYSTATIGVAKTNTYTETDIIVTKSDVNATDSINFLYEGVNYTGAHVGGVVGHTLEAVNNVKVSETNVKGETNGYVGGVAGFSYGGAISDVNVGEDDDTTVKIDSPGAYVGGVVGRSNSALSNISVTETEVTALGNHVAGVVGYINNENVTIRGVSANNIIVKGYDFIGGVAGQAVTPIYDATIKGDDTLINGHESVGGVVGRAERLIGEEKLDNSRDITVEGITVEGTWNLVGGVTGWSWSAIKNVKATDITVTGNTNVGGIAGQTINAITNIYIDGTKTITGTENVGGVVGYSENIVGIERNNGERDIVVTGIIVNSHNNNVGGVVGNANNISAIANIVVSKITVTGNGHVGGIAGFTGNQASIDNCLVEGELEGNAIEGFSSTTTLTAREAGRVGGLVGENNAEIGASGKMNTVTGIVVTSGYNDVGGALGYTGYTLNGVNSNIEVTDTAVIGTGQSATIGGAVGFAHIDVLAITKVTVTQVSVIKTEDIRSSDEGVGGLVGIAWCRVNECSVNDSTVVGYNQVGGIAGTFNPQYTEQEIAQGGIEKWLNDVLVSETTVTGIDNNVGGIAGNFLTPIGAELRNAKFIYSGEGVPIQGGSPANTGGIVGVFTGAEGEILGNNVYYGALAPQYNGGIVPISVSNAVITNAYYRNDNIGAVIGVQADPVAAAPFNMQLNAFNIDTDGADESVDSVAPADETEETEPPPQAVAPSIPSINSIASQEQEEPEPPPPMPSRGNLDDLPLETSIGEEETESQGSITALALSPLFMFGHRKGKRESN